VKSEWSVQYSRTFLRNPNFRGFSTVRYSTKKKTIIVGKGCLHPQNKGEEERIAFGQQKELFSISTEQHVRTWVPTFSPQQKKGSEFRNTFFLWNVRQWENFRNQVILMPYAITRTLQKKFLACCGAQSCSAFLTCAHHWSCSWPTSIQFTSKRPTINLHGPKHTNTTYFCVVPQNETWSKWLQQISAVKYADRWVQDGRIRPPQFRVL
jgi:hypothetical protein